MYMRLTPNPYRLGDRLHALWTFLWYKWYFDRLYDIIAVKGTLALAYLSWGFDRYIIDGAVNGIGNLFSSSSRRLRRVQTGFVANYALAIALGTVIIVGIYLIWQGDIFSQLFG
jgi:NADH-quinone oxidoreductase subunit L